MQLNKSHPIKNFFNTRFQKWIKRHIPPSRSITLNRHVIFIFPSKPGLWFGMLLLVMLLAAINYQNNMAFALVFFLSSLFVITILHTFANLSGLSISAVRAGPAYDGDNVEFQVMVSRHGTKSYFDVSLSWPESEHQLVTLNSESEQLVKLHFPATHRGLLKPGRLKIETYYPLGLLRAWTWVELDLEAVIYPKPLACEHVSNVVSDNDSGDVIPVEGTDDFYQFREYQAGDMLKHVFWKSYAKGQDLQTKQFASYREHTLWLAWEDFTGDVEKKLKNICYWVLKLEKSDNDYGLRMPGVEINPSHGELHQENILKALALFNISGHEP